MRKQRPSMVQTVVRTPHSPCTHARVTPHPPTRTHRKQLRLGRLLSSLAHYVSPRSNTSSATLPSTRAPGRSSACRTTQTAEASPAQSRDPALAPALRLPRAHNRRVPRTIKGGREEEDREEREREKGGEGLRHAHCYPGTACTDLPLYAYSYSQHAAPICIF